MPPSQHVYISVTYLFTRHIRVESHSKLIHIWGPAFSVAESYLTGKKCKSWKKECRVYAPYVESEIINH